MMAVQGFDSGIGLAASIAVTLVDFASGIAPV
jgi:hypothetical protein